MNVQVISRKDAKAQGLTRYFTGVPCKRGHVVERFVTRQCVECVGALDRAKYAANPDKALERVRAWEKANPEKKRASDLAWRASNPEMVREAMRESREANPDRDRAWGHARKAAMLNATPAWADHAAILAVFTEAVRLTRETGIPHDVDHIVPLKSPLVCGLHVAANLQPLPASVNQAKGNRHWPDMW